MTVNFPTKRLRSKRRILFVSFEVVNDPISLFAFNCTTDCNVSSRSHCLLLQFAIGLRSKEMKLTKKMKAI